MPFDGAKLQVDEVVRALTERKECTLVHLPTETEVGIRRDGGDEREPWHIGYSHYAILDKAELARALALGFHLRAMPCGRDDPPRYLLYRNCTGITAAAMKGLALARLLPGVPGDAWLWATVYEYDARGEPPEEPVPWPPAGS